MFSIVAIGSIAITTSINDVRLAALVASRSGCDRLCSHTYVTLPGFSEVLISVWFVAGFQCNLVG